MGAVCTRGGGGGRGGIDWDALIEEEEAKEAKEREKAEKKSKPSPENEEDGDAREDGDGTTKKSSKDGIEKKKKKKKKNAGDGEGDSETAPKGCDETAGGGKGEKGGGGEGEEMAKAERKAAKKAAKKASEGGQQGGVLDPLGAGEGVGADGGADDAPLSGSGEKDMDDGGRKGRRKVRSGKDDVAPDENKIRHPILKDVGGKGGQKQLCDMCNDWMDRCTCGIQEEDDDAAEFLMSMSRGGKKSKARKTLAEIREAAARREEAALRMYNFSSTSANQAATPAGKAPIPRNPNAESMAPLKPGSKARGGNEGSRQAEEDWGMNGRLRAGGRGKGLVPGQIYEPPSMVRYQRPRTPPGGWHSLAPVVVPSTVNSEGEEEEEEEEEAY